MLVAFGTTMAFTPLTNLIGQLAPPGARDSALSGQSFTLDMGASAGAALSARIAYTDFCGFLAVGMAASTMVLQVTLESAERHQLSLHPGPPADDSASHPASGPGVGAPASSVDGIQHRPSASESPIHRRPEQDVPLSKNDPRHLAVGHGRVSP
jgi:hypothetical protein